MSEQSSIITVETTSSGVAVLTLNHPPLNLITLEMSAQIKKNMELLETMESVRVVVIRSGDSSRAFCAGADIKEFVAVRDQVTEKKLAKENEAWNSIEQLSKPVIVAIEGVAFGGGCEIALACDLRVMSTSARIGLPEINLGVFPGSGGLFRLPELVGPSRAKELLFLGEPIGAEEALRIGLANRVVADGKTFTEAFAIAERIAAKSSEAIKAIKHGVGKSVGQSREDAVRLSLELSETVFQTKDCLEGIRAFFEKRPPKFNENIGPD